MILASPSYLESRLPCVPVQAVVVVGVGAAKPTFAVTNNVKHARPAVSSPHSHSHSRSTTRYQPRGPRLPVFGVKKACPTVSITNTNAARTITNESLDLILSKQELAAPQSNCIPFPSAPVPCPGATPRADDQPEDCVASSESDVAAAPAPCVFSAERTVAHPSPWPHEPIRRRRSKTCLTLHRDLQVNRMCVQDGYEADLGRRPVKNAHAQRKCAERPSSLLPASVSPPTGNEGYVPGVRRPSMSAGTPLTASQRIAVSRKNRRQTADVQFLAAMHRSISCHLKKGMAVSSSMSDADDCTAGAGADVGAAMYDQDMKLVERLWHALVEQGCRPVLIHQPQHQPQQQTEQAVTQEPQVEAGVCAPPSRSTEAPLQTSPSTPSAPNIILLSQSASPPLPSSPPPPSRRSRSLPPAPVPEVMSLPQLVALVTLRYRDRCTTRPRSAGRQAVAAAVSGDAGAKGSGLQEKARGGSPLKQIFTFPSESESESESKSDVLTSPVEVESADSSSG